MDNSLNKDDLMKNFIWAGEKTFCHVCKDVAVAKQIENFICAKHWDYELNAGFMSSDFAEEYRKHNKETGTALPKVHMVFEEEAIFLNDEKMLCGTCDQDAVCISDGGYRCDAHSLECQISGKGTEIYGHSIEISKPKPDELEVVLKSRPPKE